MSVLSQFAGGERVSSLVATSLESASMDTAAQHANATRTLSGAMAAATLQTALSISGRGRVNLACLYQNDATSRTIRMKITLDGTVIKDHTSATSTTANKGFCGIGVCTYVGGPSVVIYQPVKFSSSLLIQIASSRIESGAGNDQLTFGVNYELFA